VRGYIAEANCSNRKPAFYLETNLINNNEADVVLVFLFSYSSNYNSIEKSFSELKAWIQRHKTLTEGFENEFSAFIHMTIQKYKAEGNSERHFQNSFINCT